MVEYAVNILGYDLFVIFWLSNDLFILILVYLKLYLCLRFLLY